MWIPSTLVLLAAVTQSPSQEAPPPRAELKLLPDEGACGSSYKGGSDETGVLTIVFEDLTSAAKTGKYRASCRLAGEVVIPRGYILDPALALHAVVSGDLTEGLDNITGRLKWGMGRGSGRDFQLAEYKKPEDETDKKPQPVRLELKAPLPELPLNCTEDVRWSASLFVETTVNGTGAQARIEQMSLDGLNLLPGSCPEAQKPPHAQRNGL